MVTIGIDNQSGEILFEENGHRIYDPSQITYIKRHSNWKAKVYELSTNLKNEIDESIERNKTIHYQVPKLIDYFEIKNKIDNLNCNSYIILDYSKKKDEDIKNDAQTASRKYAECNANSNIFKKKKNIQKLYNKKLSEFIDFYKAKDADKESKYYADENKIKAQRDADYKKAYEDEKNELSKFITLDERLIVTKVTECINSISKTKVPFLLLSCKYNKLQNYTCDISINLPNESCIEHRIGNILSSGKISIKQRKQNDIKDDWKMCCSGLILFIVANVFNQNTYIQNVNISAKCKELNTAYGSQSLVDFACCDFDRNSFERINFKNINPLDTIKAFSIGNTPKVKPKVAKPKTENTKPKSPFIIECNTELSSNSISIIFAGLNNLFSIYGKSIFEASEQNRLLSAIKDVFPKNEAERQIIELLVNNACFSHFLLSSQKNITEKTIRKIIAENGLNEDDFINNLHLMLGEN